MKPVDLPVELVLRLLYGMALEDIIHMSRVCSYFRVISLSMPDVWINAKDSGNLPLTKTPEPSLLPRYACRAVSLLRKWKEPIITPVGWCRPPNDKLPSWSPWIVPEILLGFKGPLWCEFLPGAETFFVGKRTAAGIYDLHGRYGVELELAGEVVDVGWSCIEDGASLTVGLLIRDFGEDRSTVLSLYDLSESHLKRQAISPPRYIYLPQVSKDPKGMTIQLNTVVMWGDDFVLLVDMLDGSKSHLVLSEHEKDLKIIHADVLPSTPFTVVLLSEATKGRRRTLSAVQVVDNKKIAGSWDKKWETCALCLRHLESVKLPDSVHHSRNFSGRPQFALYMDHESIGIIDVDVHSTSPMWAIQHPADSAPVDDQDWNNAEYFWPCRTVSGQLFLFVLREGRVEFWQHPDRPRNQPRYLDPIAAEFVLSAVAPNHVHFTFDPVFGLLLLLADGHTLLLQY
ncbi:hypothetical protein C8F04DRAFT_1232881 [Mycena alexandri]|uniref:F-box domain-containing protein n=1 Tax=Mycena alexandri TaxID=1745969 RepID=A0AAD6X6Q3_9AGAR|nr:hypothetical protein C8F04DRAFT_1232881 [Mycena alexandri]